MISAEYTSSGRIYGYGESIEAAWDNLLSNAIYVDDLLSKVSDTKPPKPKYVRKWWAFWRRND